MFSTPHLHLLLPIIIIVLPLISASQPKARDYTPGAWSTAYWLPSPNLSPASLAVCPSYAPISCSALSEPDYCCAPQTYCAYTPTKQIGCCPWGQTCTGTINGGGLVAPQPQPQQSTWNTWTQTTWQQPVSTVFVTQGVTTTVVYAAGQTQLVGGAGSNGNGQGQEQYCSTLYAHGGNLPTTQAGTCGTILIANGVGGRGVSLGMVVVVLAGFVGFVVFQLRV